MASVFNSFRGVLLQILIAKTKNLDEHFEFVGFVLNFNKYCSLTLARVSAYKLGL